MKQKKSFEKAIVRRQIAVAVKDENVTLPGSPFELLQIAIRQGRDFPIETLERLVALHKEQLAQDAKSAFYGAFNLFQSIMPRLDRISPVDFPTSKGRVKYSFAPIGHIAAVLKEPLRQCGLSYRFKINDTEKGLSVTCIVTHIAGHSEETTMTAPADTSGAKNEIQSRASTVSYLERYTLCAALGLVTANVDNDGKEMPETINEAQAKEIEGLIESTGSELQRFLSWGKCADLKSFPASKYEEAIVILKKKKQ